MNSVKEKKNFLRLEYLMPAALEIEWPKWRESDAIFSYIKVK